MSPRGIASFAQRWVPEARSGTVVLCYHLVGAGTDSPVDVPLSMFREQLDYLEQHFDVVDLASLEDGAAEPAAPSKPRAVLTFDDAYRNFVEVVLPLLVERSWPATLYVPVGFVRGSRPPPLTGAALPACSWDELRQAAGQRVEIGSHGVDHLNLRALNGDRLRREVADSRRILQDEIGRPITSFCYPQAKYDVRSTRAVAEHYRTAVVAGGRRYTGRDPHRIPRFPIRRDERDFARMLRSAVWLPEAVADRVRQFRS